MAYGLYTGPWVESIQLNLGTGSVLNGFESIAGQINVELKNRQILKNFCQWLLWRWWKDRKEM